MSNLEPMFARPTVWSLVSLREGRQAHISVRHLHPGVPFHRITLLDPNAAEPEQNLPDGMIMIEMFNPDYPEEDRAAHAVFELLEQRLLPKELEVGYDYRGNDYALDLIDIASRVTGIQAPAITAEQNRYL